VALVALVTLLQGVSPATAGKLQLFFSYRMGPAKTGANGGTVTFESEWTNVTGNAQTAFVSKTFDNGTTFKQAADQTALSLLANKRYRQDWTFTVVPIPKFFAVAYSARGTSVPGRMAKAMENGVEIEGIKDLAVSAGIDPQIGVATFDVFSDGLTLSAGEVTLGIAGKEATTSTTRPDGSFKDFAQIKADLLQGLRDDGFGSAFLDPGTGLITVPGVSTGDPEGTAGTDVGASFETSADGVGGSAAVAVTLPEPGALALLGVGVLSLGAFCRRRGVVGRRF
jgi:hypothetical protein